MEWGSENDNETSLLKKKDFVKLLFIVIAIAGVLLLAWGIFVVALLSSENGLLMILSGVIGIVLGIFGLEKFGY